jgi:hypothetical protein
MSGEPGEADLVERTRRSLEAGAFSDLDAGLRHFAPRRRLGDVPTYVVNG